jgi:SAM-dependent methyltransferase
LYFLCRWQPCSGGICEVEKKVLQSPDNHIKGEQMHEKRFEGDIARLRSPARVEMLEVERVVKLCLEEASLKNVLDIGTGSGLFAEAFARLGLDVAGIDANPEMLAAASEHVPTGSFREGTAEELPYPQGSFDLMFFGLVLHETDEPLKAIKEAKRVALKRICILEWPYQDGEYGPPLSDRLKPETVTELADQAGIQKIETVKLANTVLYRLSI